MKKYLAILLTLAILIFAVACAPSTPPEPEPTETKPATPTESKTDETKPTEPVELEPIKIGCIQDTSGGASSAGQPNEWGALYAVKWINEHGGVNGRKIEMYTRDCQNDAAIGVTNYRELVDEVGVCAIIGPPLSNPASAWVDLATEDKIPIVGHFMDEKCTTNPETGETYPYMFLAEPSCGVQSYILAQYAMEELGVKSVATLYNVSNAFAVAHELPLVEYFEARGGQVLARENFTWGDTDYSAQAQKITGLNPDAVFLCDYVNEITTAYDNLREAGYKGIILGANTMGSPYNEIVKNKIVDSYFVQNYDFFGEKNPDAVIGDLVKAHMADTGTEYPKTNVGFGWDATMVLYHAMLKADDPTNGEEVREILENDTKDVLISNGSKLTIDPATHRPTLDLGMYIATWNDSNEIEYLDYRTTDFSK